jgi:nucleoporin SEH1
MKLTPFFWQSDFLNVVDSVSRFGNSDCFSASIAWKPREAQLQQAPASFVLGFSSDSPQLNSSKVITFIFLILNIIFLAKL